MRGSDRRRAGGMIGMTVRDDDRVEAGVPGVERRREIGQMARLADAGVDQARRGRRPAPPTSR